MVCGVFMCGGLLEMIRDIPVDNHGLVVTLSEVNGACSSL